MYEVYFSSYCLGPYDNHEDAVAAVREEWPAVVIGHSGDLTDGGDRTLIWACENDAEDDDGSGAVGQIILVGDHHDDEHDIPDNEADALTLASAGWGTDEDYGCYDGGGEGW